MDFGKWNRNNHHAEFTHIRNNRFRLWSKCIPLDHQQWILYRFGCRTLTITRNQTPTISYAGPEPNTMCQRLPLQPLAGNTATSSERIMDFGKQIRNNHQRQLHHIRNNRFRLWSQCFSVGPSAMEIVPLSAVGLTITRNQTPTTAKVRSNQILVREPPRQHFLVIQLQ